MADEANRTVRKILPFCFKMLLLGKLKKWQSFFFFSSKFSSASLADKKREIVELVIDQIKI